jgi:hypothetical protein
MAVLMATTLSGHCRSRTLVTCNGITIITYFMQIVILAEIKIEDIGDEKNQQDTAKYAKYS